MFTLKAEQIDKLSDLFMSIGKALFIATFTAPIFTQAEIITLLKLLISGIISIYFSLKLLELKNYER